MKCKIMGEYIESGQFTKKDNSIVKTVTLLSGNETVQINNAVVPPATQRLAKLEFICDVFSTKYGLMINAIN